MKLTRYLLVAGIAIAAGVVSSVLLGSGWRWYQSLLVPRIVIADVVSTTWSLPASSVGETDLGAESPDIARSEAAQRLQNPVSSTSDSVQRGEHSYAVHCLLCHGPEGRGDGSISGKLAIHPPALPAHTGKLTDGYLYATIRDGGIVMPAQGASISPSERWDLVNYLRSIQPPASQENQKEASSAASPPLKTDEGNKANEAKLAKGDSAKGKEVFEANCTRCHIADSEEVLMGPGLKGLFHWPPHQLADGREHKEHTDAIIRKQITEGGGDMPAVGASLSDQELADLIAYLRTL